MRELLRPLVTLILTSAVLMGSPGSSNMSALAVSAAYGLRRSIVYVLGLIAGTIIILVAVAAGVVAAMLSAPIVARALVYASAAYILYLAFQIARAPPLADPVSDIKAPSFVAGCVLAVANPKAWFGIAAVFTASTLVAGSGTTDGLLKVVALTVMIFIIVGGWALAGASLAKLLRDPVKSRIANIVFAVILAGTAILPLLR